MVWKVEEKQKWWTWKKQNLLKEKRIWACFIELDSIFVAKHQSYYILLLYIFCQRTSKKAFVSFQRCSTRFSWTILYFNHSRSKIDVIDVMKTMNVCDKLPKSGRHWLEQLWNLSTQIHFIVNGNSNSNNNGEQYLFACRCDDSKEKWVKNLF